MVDVLVDELIASTPGATLRQRRLVNLVDDRRHGAKGLGSVVLAAFAARRLRVELGQTPREGSGLTFARTTKLLHDGFQLFDAGFQLGDSLSRRDTAGTGGSG